MAVLLFLFLTISSWWNLTPLVVFEETKIVATIQNTNKNPIFCIGRIHGLTESGEHVRSTRGPWVISGNSVREMVLTTSTVDPFVHGWADDMKCRYMRQ